MPGGARRPHRRRAGEGRGRAVTRGRQRRKIHMSVEYTGRRAWATGAPTPGPPTTPTYPAGMTASPSPAPPQPG
ncbi:pyridine nucleotide-disulfide oxidoreductase, partial [Micrococcus sp. HSID17245]